MTLILLLLAYAVGMTMLIAAKSGIWLGLVVLVTCLAVVIGVEYPSYPKYFFYWYRAAITVRFGGDPGLWLSFGHRAQVQVKLGAHWRFSWARGPRVTWFEAGPLTVFAAPDLFWLRLQGWRLWAMWKWLTNAPTHSTGCSNQNAIHPIGRYIGAEECGCSTYRRRTWSFLE